MVNEYFMTLMRYLVNLKFQFRLLDYIIITSFVWGMYLLWLIPFQLLWVGMSWDMFVTWILWGTVLEMIFTYPIVKMSVRYAPKVTLYLQRLSDKS